MDCPGTNHHGCVCLFLCVQEKEKLYVELKGILARQPGPEVAEQLSIYQVSPLLTLYSWGTHPAACQKCSQQALAC